MPGILQGEMELRVSPPPHPPHTCTYTLTCAQTHTGMHTHSHAHTPIRSSELLLSRASTFLLMARCTECPEAIGAVRTGSFHLESVFQKHPCPRRLRARLACAGPQVGGRRTLAGPCRVVFQGCVPKHTEGSLGDLPPPTTPKGRELAPGKGDACPTEAFPLCLV